MLRHIWNTYRGWAKLARDAQAETQQWNLLALILVCAATMFGAIGSVAPVWWSNWAAGAATLCSALAAYFGKQFVGAGNEADWISI